MMNDLDALLDKDTPSSQEKGILISSSGWQDARTLFPKTLRAKDVIGGDLKHEDKNVVFVTIRDSKFLKDKENIL